MEENEANIKNKVVHTYSDDMVGVLGENQSGAVRDLIRAEEDREKLIEESSPQSKKNQIFLGLGSLLIVASLAAVFYTVLVKDKGAVNIAESYKPLIFSEQTQSISVDALNKDAIARAILNEKEKFNTAQGKLSGIYLTENKRIINLDRFMALMQSSLDTKAYEILDSNFMIGFFANSNRGKNVFVLINTNSFQGIFPYLSSWEGKMFYDLHGIFGTDLNANTSYLLNADFTDGILQNKNARILYKKDGTIALAYVYLDEKSVLLTDSESVVREVILRKASSQVPK